MSTPAKAKHKKYTRSFLRSKWLSCSWATAEEPNKTVDNNNNNNNNKTLYLSKTTVLCYRVSNGIMPCTKKQRVSDSLLVSLVASYKNPN